MEHRGYTEWIVKNYLNKRNKFLKKEKLSELISEKIIKRSYAKVTSSTASEEQVKELLAWLENIARYIPISEEKELELVIKIMITLSEERAKLNYLYDKPGLDLMMRVREYMLRFFVVLSELRANQKEYLTDWHLDEYWIFEWCHIILGLLPDDTMDVYGFPELKARDFIFLLTLELACADSATKLEYPMIRMQPSEEFPDKYIYIPTEKAVQDYHVVVKEILEGTKTVSKWVRDMQEVYKLPKK
ncbi:MAG: hypothetical protein ACFFDI_15600 [Promethearchaeota archaeon]